MQSLKEYQDWTLTTAIYPDAGTGRTPELMYLGLGLASEAAEVANKVKKIFRDHNDNHAGDVIPVLELKEQIGKELGDVMYYVARLAAATGHDLQTIIDQNRKKLESRKKRGVLSGSGDDR